MDIIAYTDGSASVAGKMKGYSGFGTYFPELFGERKGFSMGFENGKTGEMEVLALYFAIKQIPIRSKESIKLTVYADSEYVVKTFTEGRLERWRENGWRNTSGEVANKRLWISIYSMLVARKHLELELIHIKSHQVEKEKNPVLKKLLMQDPNIIGNLMADRLADYKRHSTRLKDTLELKLS